LFLVGAVILLTSSTGCISLTLGESRKGSPIDLEKIEELRLGKRTLSDVLEALGAPIEVHSHPDGMVLVYRYAAKNTFRFGLSAGGGVMSLVDVTQTLGAILDNIKLTVERSHTDEDRAVVLVGRDGIVKGVGYQDRTKDLPFF
jgi:hypothetical protein